MPKFSRFRRIAPILFFFIAGILLSTGPRSLSEPQKEGKWSGFSKIWSDKIESKGAQAAYEELKLSYSSADFDTSHMAAHFFGEILYRQEGAEAISVCDPDFAFGCYHGLFTQAVANEGLEIIEKLDNICKKKQGGLLAGCQHGIGHGLGEYMGSQKLIEQLEVCALIGADLFPHGCIGGVFMEYNFPTFFASGGASAKIREFSPQDPYRPCNSIPELYKYPCYFRQAEWWVEVLDKDYLGARDLCKSLSSQEEKSCLLGLGVSVADSNEYSKEVVEKICQALGPESKLCLAGASWISYASSRIDSLAALCSSLEGEDKTVCEENSRALVTWED